MVHLERDIEQWKEEGDVEFRANEVKAPYE